MVTIEERMRRKLRVRTPASHAQMRQDKFLEPLETQLRRNPQPVLAFHHVRPLEEETVVRLRSPDPNPTIPECCGWIRHFWKPATSSDLGEHHFERANLI